MSATNQFPPPHLIDSEEDRRAGAGASQCDAASLEKGKMDDQASGSASAEQQQRLALPSAPANEDKARQLDVTSGGRVALDELGPMVVNKDGTLSRIHNWAAMTEGERERTLRVLGKRNQVRMADIRAGEEDGEGKRE